MRYDDSYIQAYPFDRQVEGMLRPEMVLEAVDLMWQAVNHEVGVNVIIDPLLAQLIAGKFLKRSAPATKPKGQLSLWDA
jgi:hypothetical protein